MNISGFGQDEIHAACAAAAGPCFRYSDWSRAATDVKSPNAVNMIQATRLLAVDAVLRAERGDIRGALEECRAGMRLTRLSMDEPILITTLVAIADMKILLVAFNRIVCGRDVDPNLLADWMKDLDTHSWRARFERCVTAERIFTLEFELEVIGGDLGGRGGFSRGERLFYWLSRPVRKAEIIWLQLLEAFDPLFPWDPGWGCGSTIRKPVKARADSQTGSERRPSILGPSITRTAWISTAWTEETRAASKTRLGNINFFIVAALSRV